MKNWLASALKGILALAFGILILLKPSESIVLLATYFGIFALAGGLIALGYAFRIRQKGGNGTFWFIEGSTNILIGLIIIFYPHISISIFIAFFGIWAIIIAILQLSTYNRLRALNMNGGLILFNGILSLVVGLLLLFNPFEGAMIIAIIIGVYAIIYALFTLYTAFKYASAN
ncbi:MAG TPA: DUF308 domain-containing protein [Bacteroidales bacterium]|nr:DUF308 domain-containing protein [Bacteroidales bacterium]